MRRARGGPPHKHRPSYVISLGFRRRLTSANFRVFFCLPIFAIRSAMLRGDSHTLPRIHTFAQGFTIAIA